MAEDKKDKVEAPVFLRVIATSGHEHLLPYSHLLHAVMEPDQRAIELRFAIYDVFVEGEGLASVFKQIEKTTLKQLAVEKFDAAAAKSGQPTAKKAADGVKITSISVEEHD